MVKKAMTPDEWQTSRNAAAMLDHVRNIDERLVRLYACAVCRRGWALLTNHASRTVIEIAEAYADGKATEDERYAAAKAAARVAEHHSFDATDDAAEAAAVLLRGKATYSANKCSSCIARGYAIAEWGDPHLSMDSMWEDHDPHIATELSVHAEIVRDLFGNPFVPLPEVAPEWLDWNNRTIPKVANDMYESRTFDKMPELAECLRNAGCRDQSILNHCDLVDHYRGCWVVDLLIGNRTSA